MDWPNNAPFAAAITFDMDADSLIHAAEPDGWQRPYVISMGQYGPTVGIPRILETYRRLEMRQTFFIPGWCVKTYPRAVEAILEGGHEIGCHGWIHENPSARTLAEQGEDLDRALDAMAAFSGYRPRGYRAPVYLLTNDTPALIADRGFAYDSSMMADDDPYALDLGGRTLIEVPTHWGIDDWPPFAHYAEIGYMMPVRGPTEGLAPFFEEFEAAKKDGGLWHAVWHPFLTGRRARWQVVERWLESALTSGAWFATLGEIADHAEALRREGRLRTLPFPTYTERQT
ncbi:polysaccharide deacetylase [Frigidibacter sp.]|uniref:polysaccharide deacetylase family protein n=1 Tax=Frigidibacter sp. TaxID=2586418 RepID=UPI0027322DD9|nr:polysaccharide deacetylase [Frigidibacter sp.]MDP3339336.1 polysaccharide deacetylase [Frigidibacter sp.]